MTEEVLEKEGVDDDAAARGYARVSGEEPATEVKAPAAEVDATAEAPEVVEPPKAEAQPAAAPVAATPNVDELTAKVVAGVLEQITPKINAIDGRVGGINRELKNVIATAQQRAAATGTEAPTDKQIAAAAADPEKWKQLKEDFPQFAEGIEEYVAARVATTKPQAQPAVDHAAIRSEVINEIAPKFEQQINAARDDGAKQGRVYARIDAAVGDGWEEQMRSEAFGAWFSKLPAEKQKQYDSFNAPDVIACLKEFGTHQDAAKTRQAKTERLAAAAQVQSTGTGGPPILTDEDAAARGYNRVARR
jgi:hypothetical protein